MSTGASGQDSVDNVNTGRALPPQLLDVALLDKDGASRSLGELCKGRVTLIVFLRHFGCVGCSQQVDALVPIVDELHALSVLVIFVGNGEPRFIAGFVERQRLAGHPIAIVTDPTLRAYETAGFARSAWSTIGPVALWADLVAMAKGYFSAGRQGDVFQQGGVLLASANGRVLFHKSNRTAPEPIPTGDIMEAVLSHIGSRARVERKGIA